MGFEKRNENVFCDRYRRHATFRGICVFFFARSDSSKRKLGAVRTQERMFQCFQAAQDNFQIRPTRTNVHFHFLGVASAFFAKIGEFAGSSACRGS